MPKDLMVAIGIPKRGGGDDIGEPDAIDSQPKRGMPKQEEKPEEESGGIRPEDVDYSAGDLCLDCRHNAEGHCQRYGFAVEDSGHCEAGYEPRDGGEEMPMEGQREEAAPSYRG